MGRARLLFVALVALVAIAVVACGSGGGEGARVPVSPIVDVSCVFLRLTNDARVDEVCATLEELAPYVPEIIAMREERDAGPAPDGVTIAFSVRDPCAKPRRSIPRRNRDAGAALVVRVVPIEDAGASDAAE